MADKFSLKAILSATDKLSPVLKSINKATKTTRKHLIDVAHSVGNLGRAIAMPVAALTGLSVGFSIEAVREAIKGYADFGSELTALSYTSGLTTTQLQQMKYLAEQSGVTFETLTDSIGKMNMRLGDAAAGKNKDVISLFKKLKIPLKDANGQLRSAVDLLPELSIAFQRNTNAVTRARMGNVLFGRSWEGIMPLLAEGGEAAETLANFNKRFGAFSEENIKQARKLGDQFTDVGYTFRYLMFGVAAKLTPIISPIIDRFIDWAAANKAVIQTNITEYVMTLGRALASIDWAGIGESIKSVGRFFGNMADMVGGAKNLLIALGVIIMSQTIVALGQLAAAVVRFGISLGALALANPLILAISVAIGALVYAGYQLYKNWDAFKDLFSDIWEGIKKTVSASIDWIVSKINWLKDHLSVFNKISEFFGGGSFSSNVNVSNRSAPIQVQQQARAKVDVNFVNAPQGMRVDRVQADKGVTFNPKVGYRTAYQW